ncbi:hypothetical protein KXV37_008628, partial [Aspergillus fumigatus]
HRPDRHPLPARPERRYLHRRWPAHEPERAGLRRHASGPDRHVGVRLVLPRRQRRFAALHPGEHRDRHRDRRAGRHAVLRRDPRSRRRDSGASVLQQVEGAVQPVRSRTGHAVGSAARASASQRDVRADRQ